MVYKWRMDICFVFQNSTTAEILNVYILYNIQLLITSKSRSFLDVILKHYIFNSIFNKHFSMVMLKLTVKAAGIK